MIIVPEDLHPGSKKMGQESRARVQREDTVRFRPELTFPQTFIHFTKGIQRSTPFIF